MCSSCGINGYQYALLYKGFVWKCLHCVNCYLVICKQLLELLYIIFKPIVIILNSIQWNELVIRPLVYRGVIWFEMIVIQTEQQA